MFPVIDTAGNIWPSLHASCMLTRFTERPFCQRVISSPCLWYILALEHLLSPDIAASTALWILRSVIDRLLIFLLKSVEVILKQVLLVKFSACLFFRACSSFIIVYDIALLAAYLPSMSLVDDLSVGVSFEEAIVLSFSRRVHWLIVSHDECFVKQLWSIFEVACPFEVLFSFYLPVLRTDSRCSTRGYLVDLRSSLARKSSVMVYAERI